MLNTQRMPKDWSNLSVSEIYRNIQYLQQHYKTRIVRKIDNKTIKIGSVTIYKDNVYTRHGVVSFFTINGAIISDAAHPELYAMVGTLYNDCSTQTLGIKLKNKASDWWKSNAESVIVTGQALAALTIISCMFGHAVDKEKKKMQEQIKIEQEKNRSIQELQDRIKNSLNPQNDKDQKPEKSNILMVNDSLWQHVR